MLHHSTVLHPTKHFIPPKKLHMKKRKSPTPKKPQHQTSPLNTKKNLDTIGMYMIKFRSHHDQQHVHTLRIRGCIFYFILFYFFVLAVLPFCHLPFACRLLCAVWGCVCRLGLRAIWVFVPFVFSCLLCLPLPFTFAICTPFAFAFCHLIGNTHTQPTHPTYPSIDPASIAITDQILGPMITSVVGWGVLCIAPA
ncbi:hypothetical protein K439DRAFT_471503 [Ramaria rubella]|nr:hypothetical protein K439DRAFT_471503 [Ramaria rubella]